MWLEFILLSGKVEINRGQVDELKYEVSVEVTLMLVFAQDEAGNPVYAGKDIPSCRMNGIQKRLFAFDALFGGKWSRISGTISKLKIEEVSCKKNDDNVCCHFKAEVPENLKGVKADLFFIQYNRDTHAVQMKMKREALGERIVASIDGKTNDELHLVVVEPENTFCLTVKVRR